MEIYKDEKRTITSSDSGMVTFHAKKGDKKIYLSSFHKIGNFNEDFNEDFVAAILSNGDNPETYSWLIDATGTKIIACPTAAAEIILKLADDYRAATQAAIQKAIEACPADCLPCRQYRGKSNIYRVEYQAEDGTIITYSDLMDGHGCGIYYIPRSEFDQAITLQAQLVALKEMPQDQSGNEMLNFTLEERLGLKSPEEIAAKKLEMQTKWMLKRAEYVQGLLI